MIIYLLRFRLHNFVESNKKPLRFLVNFLILSGVVMNALLAGFTLAYFRQSHAIAQWQNVQRYLRIMILVIPVIALFFPNYQYRTILFKPTDPIGVWRKTGIELLYGLCTPFFGVLLAGIAVFHLAAGVGSLSFLAYLLIVMSASVFRLLLQFSLESGRYKLRLLLLSFLLLAGMGFLLWYPMELMLIYLLAYLALLMGIYVLLQYTDAVYFTPPVERSSGKHRILHAAYCYLIRAYFKTTSIRYNLLIAFFFKLVFMIIMYKHASASSDDTTLKPLIKLMLSSSLILFTYIHNNMWGYMVQPYRNMAQLKSRRGLLLAYLSLLLIPLLVDIVITAPFIISRYSGNRLHFGLFYLFTLCCNVLVGFVASLDQPREIKRAIDFTSLTGNTPIGYNFLGIVICLVSAYLMGQSWFPYVFPGGIAICIYCIVRMVLSRGPEKTDIYYKL